MIAPHDREPNKDVFLKISYSFIKIVMNVYELIYKTLLDTPF